MKTLIVSSSLSPSSKSFIICEIVYEKLKAKGVDVSLVDARDIELLPYYRGPTKDMEELVDKIDEADNIIFGMGVHCYSINDGLKIIIDSLGKVGEGKFFGILCAAGGHNSYLSTMHLTQICMNEHRMMQLPRIVYATNSDFDEGKLVNEDVIERIDRFCEEFRRIGMKLV